MIENKSQSSITIVLELHRKGIAEGPCFGIAWSDFLVWMEKGVSNEL